MDRIGAIRVPLGIAIQAGRHLIPGMPSEDLQGNHDMDNTNVSAGYFDTMGVELMSGRSLERADMGGDRVVVVNEVFVDRYFPGCDLGGLERPLGHRRYGDRDVRHDPSHSGCCRAVCRVCADSPGELSRSGWSP